MTEALVIVIGVAVAFALQEAVNRWLYWKHDGEKVRRHQATETSHRESWLRRRRR